jgi:hypothetical protein
MNPDTGRIELIATEEDAQDAKRRGLLPLSAEDLKGVEGMNRQQRRAWAAQRRREMKRKK